MGLLHFRATAEKSIFRVGEDLQVVSKRWVKARQLTWKLNDALKKSQRNGVNLELLEFHQNPGPLGTAVILVRDNSIFRLSPVFSGVQIHICTPKVAQNGT